MFHKAKLFSVLFFLLIAGAFAESSVMHLSMSLKTTTIDKDGNTNLVPAKIIYSKKDESFSFESFFPENEKFYYDSTGCFYQSPDGKIIQADDYRSDLEQTCSDLINYFKSDFGLFESQYKITDNKIQNGLIESKWTCFGNGEFFISTIKSVSDKKGRLTKLSMYDFDNNLMAKTLVDSYASDGKYFYPEKIISYSYTQDEKMTDQLIFTTILEFSDVKLVKSINFSADEKANLNKIPAKTTENITEEKHSNSDSIAGLLVSSAYSFYKKFITDQDIPGCQFYPTCSHYMADCVKAYGIFGIIKGYDRIKRCNRSEKSRNLYDVRSDGRLIDYAK